MADHLQKQNLKQNTGEERRQFWRSHIDAWSISGLSQVKYCRQNNLQTTRFTYWKCKFSRENLPIEFVQVPTGPVKSAYYSKDHSTPSLCLTIDSRFCIDIPNGFSPATLEQVLLILKGV